MFVVVFISSVIQITFVLSSFLVLVKIITDTVWLQVAFQLADTLINDISGSYHVIFSSRLPWIGSMVNRKLRQ